MNLSQQTATSVPVAAASRKRSCTFCNSTGHARWDKCSTEGRASEIGGTVVQPEKASHRELCDNIRSGTCHFEVSVSSSTMDTVHDSVPRGCKHVMIEEIGSIVDVSPGGGECSNPVLQNQKVAKLQLFGAGAATMSNYEHGCFKQHALLDWMTVQSAKKGIKKNCLFHKLERIVD